jgi:hypothetical protein
MSWQTIYVLFAMVASCVMFALYSPMEAVFTVSVMTSILVGNQI